MFEYNINLANESIYVCFFFHLFVLQRELLIYVYVIPYVYNRWQHENIHFSNAYSMVIAWLHLIFKRVPPKQNMFPGYPQKNVRACTHIFFSTRTHKYTHTPTNTHTHTNTHTRKTHARKTHAKKYTRTTKIVYK